MVAVPREAIVRQDSGAFSYACLNDEERSVFAIQENRLSFREALEQQERHAEALGYADQIEARASYDVLIDETWSQDEFGILTRKKQRWSESTAEEAVKITVAAAAYLGKHRNGIPCIMSAQGVTPQQYLRCSQQVVRHMQAEDIFGLGGWCILGRRRSLLPMFRETMHLVIPFLGKEGVKQVHLWGCLWGPAIGELLYLCDQYQIVVAVDSVGPTTRPVIRDDKNGIYSSWGYSSWHDSKYPVPPILDSCKQLDLFGKKAPTCGAGTRCRGLERARHVEATREWLAQFRSREPQYYRSSEIKTKTPDHQQLSLFTEGIA
jgi:hypothetical protein